MSVASYSTFTLFLTFRSSWGPWKGAQMIPHTPKHLFWHQNQVSSMLRSQVTPQRDFPTFQSNREKFGQMPTYSNVNINLFKNCFLIWLRITKLHNKIIGPGRIGHFSILWHTLDWARHTHTWSIRIEYICVHVSEWMNDWWIEPFHSNKSLCN